MPSVIPYDPSLTLMSVVSQATLKNIEQVVIAQAPVDAAQDTLNSLISSRRSLHMTQTELRNLGVDTISLDAELNNINDSIDKAASTYAKEKVAAEVKTGQLRENVRIVQTNVESPVDNLKTEIKTMPLAADTMNMEVQYFSYDSNSQNAAAYSSQIAAFVSKSAGGIFSPEASLSIGGAASTQIGRQVKTHHIQGTLVLCIACTHKNASVLAPFHLHVDKAIKVWNRLFPGKKLDPSNTERMMKVAMNESQEDKEKFSIVSGTTFGSSFVGMVHILDSTDTQVAEALTASAKSMQAQMNSGSWLSSASDKTGVDKKFASDMKDLLSQQNVTSRVTVLSMGIVPSKVANQDSGTVESFTKFDSTEEANKLESSLSAVAVTDGDKDEVPDIEFMMRALDEHLKAAEANTGGVPINHYLKDIDAKMLAEMWAAKYYPGKHMAI